MTKFPKLFEPLCIGSLVVRNRIFQPAHSKLYSEHGADTRRDLDYYAARARGGAALLITGERLVHPSSPTGRPRFAYAYLRKTLEADRAITAAVHAAGAAIFAQLNHVGVEGASDGADDPRFLLAPSEVDSPLFAEVPKVMEEEDVAAVVDGWAQSAEHAREGGFDGVELHLAHGYLLHQFLSPLYNRRDDRYGGTLVNRLRLTREVIAAIRERVGRDYVVGVRLGLTEFVEGGLEIDDAVAAAGLLADDGQIDFVNTSGGGYHSGQHRLIAPSDTEDGWSIERVAQLKHALPDMPVFAVGSLHDPNDAHEAIASGSADMVGMTRALIADPELPEKLRTGREREQYRCIKGNQGCISRVWRGLPMACTVNPAAGREGFFQALGAHAGRPPGRWVVVGGGPAGMKAAETLAMRGAGVTLFERDERLGGQLNLLARAPGRSRFMALAEDLADRLGDLEVDVRCGVGATVEALAELEFDGLIVATGAHPEREGYSSAAPARPGIPGSDREDVVTGWDVMYDPSVVRGRVVVLDDRGTREVAGVAELLLDRGHEVELVSRWTSLFPWTATTLDQPLLHARLLGKGMTYRLGHWAAEIGEASVTVYSLPTGERTELAGVGTVVLATGRRADVGLYSGLRAAGYPALRIGDCMAPRTLDHAVYEGYLAGHRAGREEVDRYIDEGRLEPFA